MKIVLSCKNSKVSLNLTKYEWFKIAKQKGIVFVKPNNIKIGSISYSEGDEISLDNKNYMIKNIENGNKLTVLCNNGEEKQINIDSNGYPIEKWAKQAFNCYPANGMQVVSNQQHMQQNKNIVCAWCKKPIGHNEELSDNRISHGICDECLENHFSDFKSEASKSEIRKLIEAQNQVNMGADVNSGMELTPTEPTNQQAQQTEHDMMADFDMQNGFSSMQNFKKSLSPQDNMVLKSALLKLKIPYPQFASMIRNPQMKNQLMMMLDEMAKSPKNKINGLKPIIDSIQHVTEKEMKSQLRTENPTQQTVQDKQVAPRTVNPNIR